MALDDFDDLGGAPVKEIINSFTTSRDVWAAQQCHCIECLSSSVNEYLRAHLLIELFALADPGLLKSLGSAYFSMPDRPEDPTHQKPWSGP